MTGLWEGGGHGIPTTSTRNGSRRRRQCEAATRLDDSPSTIPDGSRARAKGGIMARRHGSTARQLRIPKLRQGSYFPRFLEARESWEKA